MAAAKGYFNLAAHQRPSVGDTKTSVLGIDHMGWLICDGRLLNVNDWKFLFDVVGYSFGSNITGTQFQLPNPAGRVPGFVGSGSGLTARSMGSNVGTETHTLIINEMPAHTHGSVAATGNNNGNGNTTSYTHSHGGSTSGLIGGTNIVNSLENVYNSLSPLNAVVNAGEGTHDHTISDDTHNHQIYNTGGGQPHNNMQPTLFLGNLFIYSGKVSYGNNPFTAGIYANTGSSALTSNLV